MTPYYEQDGITIYHGDCREMLPHMAPGSIDLVLTDPPYGVGLDYASHDDNPEAYADWIVPVFEQMRRVGRVVMLTPGIRNIWLYPPATWALCWGKPGSPRRSDLGGFNEWEPVLMYGKRRIYNDFKRLPAWNNTSTHTGDHPCPKPIALMHWLVTEGADDGALILDPFMGSGTTLRAAKDLGRKAIGIEIEERYCEIAVKRLQQSVLPLEGIA